MVGRASRHCGMEWGMGKALECNAMFIQGFTNCSIDMLNILIFLSKFLNMLILCLQLYKLQSRGEVSLTVTSDTQC